jgi:hypothetical protein
MANGLFGNWRTSLLGAISGAATYLLIGPGATFPQTKADWGVFLVGLLQAIWGAVQKDTTTGSKAAVSS